MQTNHDETQKDSEAIVGIKSCRCDKRGRATANKTTAPRGPVPGVPGTLENVRNDTYHEQRHNCNDDERVPSAGWREVYHAMGVSDE